MKKSPLEFTIVERRIVLLSVAFAAFFAVPGTASAMHIMEGYLPLQYCVIWGVASVPFVVIGVMRLRKVIDENKRALILLAMSGAFIFVISSLKIPSVTGSCSHMTGTGLSTILFGVPITSILAIIVLIFQAILLAHGGLTTLGANTFSMGIAGPLLTLLLFTIGDKMKANRLVNTFVAVMLGDLFTYCITSIQLALAYPSEVGGVAASAVKFLSVFAPTQIPLSVIEGILTVLIIMGMQKYAKRELEAVSFMEAR